MKTVLILLFNLFITINIFAIDPPALYYPENNTTGWYTDRSVRCYLVDSDTDPNNYTFQMDVVSTFDSPSFVERQGTNYETSPPQIRLENIDLLYNQTYYWRVKVTDGVETSDWSETWNFTTLESISLDYPGNNSTNHITDRSLRCNLENFNTDFNNYEFEMDTTPNFNSSLYEFSVADGYNSSSGYIWKENTDLLYGQKYYWRARVKNTNDNSEWSVTWNFTTKEKVNLYNPSNNSTNQITDRSISCYDEDYNTDFENYEFEIDTTPNFNSSFYEISHGTSYSSGYVYKSNTDLLYGQKYYWRARVRNTNDTSAWSDTWNFTTKEKVYLYSPDNNSVSLSINTTVKCYDEDYNTNYENYDFQLDTTDSFNSPILIATHGTSYSSGIISKTNSNLRYGQKYYWRARVRNTNDTSAWSSVWNFKTDYELTDLPVLISPANNSTGISYTSFLIDWDGIAGANQYQYQISTSNDFATVVKTGTTSSTNRTITNLEQNTIYYWRVRGENVNGYSPWSEVWNFTTEGTLLNTPVLISPGNGADNQLTELTLDWNSVGSATSYEYQYSTDNTFTTYENGTTSNTEVTISGLEYETQYFWRVQATDGSIFSDWSAVWSFTTEPETSVYLTTDMNIEIFPNPVNDHLYLNSDISIRGISVYNITGKKIFEENVIKDNYILNTCDYPEGVYIINFKFNDSIISKKFLVKHF